MHVFIHSSPYLYRLAPVTELYNFFCYLYKVTGVGNIRFMNVMESFLSIGHVKIGAVLIAFLLFILWAINIVRKLRTKFQVAQQRKAEIRRIQELRKQYKKDISTFIKSYRNDISTKLEENKVDNGLFVFWSGADEIFKKFQSDTSQISKLPDKEERIAIRSFYTEAKSLIDGILYNNHLLKKYQYLRCKIKTTTATSAEVDEVKNVAQQMSMLGAQLRQQHHELLASLSTIKSYF